MASTRISKYQAEQLARLLAEGFTSKERTALIARQSAAHRAIADRLFTPELINQITSLQESIPDVLRGATSSESVYLLDQKGEKRHSARHTLNYALAYGAEENRKFALDLRTNPSIKVTQRQFDAFISANEAAGDLVTRTNALRKELLANILTARTVEKLLEKWPEASSAIASFFNHAAPPTNVEVPLESLVRRHVNVPALAAPAQEATNG